MPARIAFEIPPAPSPYSVRLLAPVNIGTSLTNVFTSPLLIPPGEYAFESYMAANHTGTTGLTVTPGFTGTGSGVCFTAIRCTASGLATSNHFNLQASGSSLWTALIIIGSFTVTGEGFVTLGCTRTGGTNTVIPTGAFLKIEEM